jgi:predicted unusual protein kinase regulating ubiquinone biosynthesis (AarF/ABC1/UbiB family)
MFEQQPFRLPAQMTFILKSLTTLDGIARSLDPEYNLVAAAQPFVRSITVSQKGRAGAVGELARQAKDLIVYRLNKPSRTEVWLRSFERRLEEGELKVRVRAVESERTLKRINLAIKSLIYASLAGFAFLAGAVLLVGKYKTLAMGVFVFAGVIFVILIHSLFVLKVKENLDNLAEK